MKDLIKRVVGLKEKARLTEIFDKKSAAVSSSALKHE